MGKLDPKDNVGLQENPVKEDSPEVLAPLDPLDTVNSVMVLLNRQTDKLTKKVLELDQILIDTKIICFVLMLYLNNVTKKTFFDLNVHAY